MSRRSQQIAREKAKAAELGHEMGNAVNVAPFTRGADWTVRCRCRKCGRTMFIDCVVGIVNSWGDWSPNLCSSVKVPEGNTMKVIIKDYVNGRNMTIVFPDPEPGSSQLVLGIRTEHQPPDDPTRSLAAREVYVGPKGGITVRTV